MALRHKPASIDNLNSPIIISQADEGHAQRFVNLLNATFVVQRPSSYFNWRYTHGRHPTALFVAVHDDTMLGALGIELRKLNNDLPWACVMEIVVKSQYQRKGVFRALEQKAVEFAEKHRAVGISVLANKPGMLAHVGCGWRNSSMMPVLELIGKTTAQFDINCKQNLASVSLIKDDAYYEFRCSKHPHYKYVRLSDSSSNFAIIKIFTEPATGQRIGDIVDYSVGRPGIDNTKELFLSAIRHLHAENIDTVTTWALPHTQYNALLKNMGFKEKKSERYFCTKILDSQWKMLGDISNWHLVQIDSELY